MATNIQTVQRRSRREYLLFAAFLAPNLVLLAFFVYKPLVEGIWLSFFEWDLISPDRLWVGLGNYKEYFTDPSSWLVLRTTLIFAGGTVAATMSLGLGTALLLNQALVGRTFARTVLFTPYVVSGAAIGILWLFVFDPHLGIVAALLAMIGVKSPDWFNDPGWALLMVIIAYAWKNLGYATTIFIAGLQGIPADLYEAARVDGAGRFARFRHITLPMLSPVTFFLLVTSVLASMQAFDLIQVMTQGGPLEATRTMNYQLYEEAFVHFHIGLGSTIATLLFVILLGVTVLQVRFVERRVHYS